MLETFLVKINILILLIDLLKKRLFSIRYISKKNIDRFIFLKDFDIKHFIFIFFLCQSIALKIHNVNHNNLEHIYNNVIFSMETIKAEVI